MKPQPTMLWVGASNNRKTGNIPQGYVGIDKAEVERSCEGCPMRYDGCYHWTGSRRAQAAMQKAAAVDVERYSLSNAISKSVRSARYIRAAVGGDPWIFSRETVEGWHSKAIAKGFKGIIMYTHFANEKARHLKGLALASVHSLEEPDARIREGWRGAMVAPGKVPGSKRSTLNPIAEWQGEEFITPDGVEGRVCPAQVKRGVNCNTCGLCDPTRDADSLIVFLQH